MQLLPVVRMTEPASEEEAALLNSKAVEVNEYSRNAGNGLPLTGSETSVIASHNVHDARLDLDSLTTHEAAGSKTLTAGDVEEEEEEEEEEDDDDPGTDSQVDEGEDEWEVDDDDESAYEELLEGLTDETLHARSGMSPRWCPDSITSTQLPCFSGSSIEGFSVCEL